METLGNDWKQNTINTESELLKFCLQKKGDPVYLYTFARRFKIYTRVQ